MTDAEQLEKQTGEKKQCTLKTKQTTYKKNNCSQVGSVKSFFLSFSTI